MCPSVARAAGGSLPISMNSLSLVLPAADSAGVQYRALLSLPETYVRSLLRMAEDMASRAESWEESPLPIVGRAPLRLLPDAVCRELASPALERALEFCDNGPAWAFVRAEALPWDISRDVRGQARTVVGAGTKRVYWEVRGEEARITTVSYPYEWLLLTATVVLNGEEAVSAFRSLAAHAPRLAADLLRDGIPVGGEETPRQAPEWLARSDLMTLLTHPQRDIREPAILAAARLRGQRI